jgi:hypothetical protein
VPKEISTVAQAEVVILLSEKRNSPYQIEEFST